jgi:hypothetical protein
MKPDIGKLASSVDGNEEMQLSFCGSHFCDIDVEVTNRISLEFLLGSLVAINIRQPFNAMTLKAAMQ